MNKRLVSYRCEKALIQIAAGNTGALAEIYETAGRQMFALAYTVIQDYQLAEDAVQDSLIRVAEHAAEVKKQGSALAWIMRIVHNTALNLIRSRQHELLPGELAEDSYTGEEMGLSAESVQLQEALRALDVQDRQIVLMKAVIGLSHREIAQTLDIPLAACQKRYQRNLKRLKEMLE